MSGLFYAPWTRKFEGFYELAEEIKKRWARFYFDLKIPSAVHSKTEFMSSHCKIKLLRKNEMYWVKLGWKIASNTHLLESPILRKYNCTLGVILRRWSWSKPRGGSTVRGNLSSFFGASHLLKHSTPFQSFQNKSCLFFSFFRSADFFANIIYLPLDVFVLQT